MLFFVANSILRSRRITKRKILTAVTPYTCNAILAEWSNCVLRRSLVQSSLEISLILALIQCWLCAFISAHHWHSFTWLLVMFKTALLRTRQRFSYAQDSAAMFETALLHRRCLGIVLIQRWDSAALYVWTKVWTMPQKSTIFFCFVSFSCSESSADHAATTALLGACQEGKTGSLWVPLEVFLVCFWRLALFLPFVHLSNCTRQIPAATLDCCSEATLSFPKSSLAGVGVKRCNWWQRTWPSRGCVVIIFFRCFLIMQC